MHMFYIWQKCNETSIENAFDLINRISFHCVNNTFIAQLRLPQKGRGQIVDYNLIVF